MCGHFKLIVASNKIVLLYSLNINWSVFEGSLNNSKITKTVNIVNNGICYLLVIIELCLIHKSITTSSLLTCYIIHFRQMEDLNVSSINAYIPIERDRCKATVEFIFCLPSMHILADLLQWGFPNISTYSVRIPGFSNEQPPLFISALITLTWGTQCSS